MGEVARALHVESVVAILEAPDMTSQTGVDPKKCTLGISSHDEKCTLGISSLDKKCTLGISSLDKKCTLGILENNEHRAY